MNIQEKYYTDTKNVVSFVPDMKKSPLFNLLFRARDIFIASVGLIFLSPLFVFIAIKIKRDSPGPVFYRGPRVGKDGVPFKILKFRTMYENSASYQGPRITGENDSRVTKVGSWLRETKLNELPQLWNVLTGDMSLVGPRPEDPEIAKTWPQELRREILSIRPGITSPASVLFRDEETMLSSDFLMETYLGAIQPNKLRLDQLYVRYRSLWVDFDVLLWTFLVLIPRTSKPTPPERLLYGGLVFRGFHLFTRWFFVDFLIALAAVATSGLIWRAIAPIHMGLWRGFVEAIEFSVLFTLLGSLLGVQKIQWSKASPTDILELFASSLAATLLWLLLNHFHHKYPAELIVTGALLAFSGIVVARYRSRVFTGFASRWLRMRKDKVVYRERVLIIGSGDAGSFAAWMLSNSKEGLEYNVVGYLDDDFQKQGTRYRGIEVLGGVEDLEKITQKYDVGIILFAIHRIDEEKRAKILKRCEATKAQVVMFPNIIGHLSDALNQNGNSSQNDRQAYSTAAQNPGQTIGETMPLLSPTKKARMTAVLEELQTNLELSETEKSYQNIALLHELIAQIKEEDPRE